jgi:hypothetical protein
VTEAQDFSACVDKLVADFRLYDKTVDLVSCWECLYTEVRPFRDQTLYFDRFPRMMSPQESERHRKTPEFAVLVSDSYGFVGEVKGGFPLDEDAFRRHLERLKKYDRPLCFKKNDAGDKLQPITHDIVLIIPFRDAQEVVRRIEALQGQSKVKFERSLVVVEWVYDSEGDEYIFRPVAGQTGDFSDSTVPDGVRLSKLLTESRASLKIAPDQIKDIKARWQFCNDEPRPIYTVVFLWMKILYHFLSDAQRETWRRGNPQKGLPIDLTVQRVVTEISQRYPMNWGHWTDWVTAALEALATAGLAKKIENDRYLVSYRNLTREVGVSSRGVSVSGTRHRPADYARILATYICRGHEREKNGPVASDEPGPQGRLQFPGPANSQNGPPKE